MLELTVVAFVPTVLQSVHEGGPLLLFTLTYTRCAFCFTAEEGINRGLLTGSCKVHATSREEEAKYTQPNHVRCDRANNDTQTDENEENAESQMASTKNRRSIAG